MTKTGAVRPEDLSVLEDIIRQRLSGETPATMTRSIMVRFPVPFRPKLLTQGALFCLINVDTMVEYFRPI